MGNRKSLSKKTRFEVFKRDHFTCQYCGRMAPDVILEVDHIKPVAEGGTNSMINLITSCRDCNRGKGKRRISDATELKKQQVEMKDLAERREQIEMLAEWRNSLVETEDTIVDSLNSYIEKITGRVANEIGKAMIRKLLKQFSVEEIYEGIDISFAQYYDGTSGTWEYAFDKIGGICYNRRKNADKVIVTTTVESIVYDLLKKEADDLCMSIPDLIHDIISVYFDEGEM